ncbi:MAG: haloacid dehalogenase-like hydrolase [Endomicrobium sp.]|jgi:phosphoserine phosphatase|nr:haloacid dehalogenase-like hydrolase [Endomicrobium sp.]
MRTPFNTYDFDGTIYDGDSTVDFYLFSLKKSPKLLLTLLPNFVNVIRFKLKLITRSEFKEQFYKLFLPKIDTNKFVEQFWQAYEHKIKQWYLTQKQPSDLIISASADFLLEPICQKLSVHLLASKVDPKTGKLLSPNLRGIEKVKLFQKHYSNQTIDNFYTDQISDKPMMELAKHCFLVDKNKILRL